MMTQGNEQNHWIRILGLDELDSLAIMGLGKNAGKTTVLNHILRACERTAFPRALALTSIGRDGEDRDLVTGRKKPRIFAGQGTLVATACDSAGKCDAVLEILALTGIRTAKGEVVIARTRSKGYLELAGPSMARDLALCERLMRGEEADCLFVVDGALDRKSQAGGGLTQAVVLVAGMANAGSIEELALKTAEQVRLLTLPRITGGPGEALRDVMRGEPSARAVITDGQDKVRLFLAIPSLVGHEREVADALREEDRTLLLRGAITDRLLDTLLSREEFRGMRLVAEDGTRFFIQGRTLARLQRHQISLTVIHGLKLPAVFVNPARRGGSLVDSKILVRTLQAALDLPVIDAGPAQD